MRNDDFEQASDPYRPSGWPARLVWGSLRFVIFTGVVVIFFTGLLVVLGRWQQAGQGSRIVVAEGAEDLSTAERLALQLFLIAQSGRLSAAAGPAVDPIDFTVTPGQNANQIAINLSSVGALDPRNETVFLNYLRFYGLDAQLTAGAFSIPPGLTIPQLADLLIGTAVSAGLTVRFIEGWRAEQFADALAAQPIALIDPGDFIAIVRRELPFDIAPYPFLNGLGPTDSLEGFLFPDTYEVAATATAVDLINLMLRTFGERVSPTVRQAYGARGLTTRQAVTLASIVEREAVLAEERPLIAAVFLNRLAQGMRLDADPTVQYALGYDAVGATWWKQGLTVEDLQINSPFNTYRLVGLPPGPIANPSLSALQAVAEPAATDYLFFVADCNGAPGSHLFSVTYEEHLVNVAACR